MAELAMRWIGVDNSLDEKTALEAITIARRSEAPYSEAVAHTVLGMIYGNYHSPEMSNKSTEHHALAISLFRENGYILHEAGVYSQMAGLSLGTDHPDAVAHYIGQINDSLSEFNWKEEPDGDGLPLVNGERTPAQLYSLIQAGLLFTMGTLGKIQGDWNEAVYSLIDAWKYALSANYPWMTVGILTELGQSLQGYGKLDVAGAVFNKALIIVEELGLLQYLDYCYALKLELLLDLKDMETVQGMIPEIAKRSESTLEEHGHLPYYHGSLMIKSIVRAYVELDQYEDAQYWLDKALYNRNLNSVIKNELYFLQGEIHMQCGNIKEARRFFSQAFKEGKTATATVFKQKIIEQQQLFNVRLAREEAEIQRLKTVELRKLLLNVLPERVVDELQQLGFSKPELFSDVSVMFTDFVGFTQKASALTPVELLEELSALFSLYDEIIQDNGCERIKTIGDGYMAVCGVPENRTDHADRLVQAGMEIIELMETRRKNRWEIRAGIHSGLVIGGIVGKAKYAYDIFGDTINVASRMESSSKPMKLNMSESTYLKLSEAIINNPQYEFISRGAVEVKGKGDMKMWFVTR